MKHLLTVVRRAAVFVDRWQWALLLLAAPWLLFPTPGRTPLLLMVPGLWIIAGLGRREFLPRTPLNGSLLVLAMMILISLYATYDIGVSLPKIAGLLLGLGVFFAVVRLGRDRRAWKRCSLAFLVLGVGLAALGLLGTQWLNKIAFLAPLLARLPPMLRGMPGAEGGFQPNEVAGSLLWVLPALLIVSLQQCAAARRSSKCSRSDHTPPRW
jgi:putative inorganic carbon (hco3(-)) transporter